MVWRVLLRCVWLSRGVGRRKESESFLKQLTEIGIGSEEPLGFTEAKNRFSAEVKTRGVGAQVATKKKHVQAQCSFPRATAG